MIIFAIILLFSSILIYYLYQKKKAAYHELVEKNKQWADSDDLEQRTVSHLHTQSAPEENTCNENNGIDKQEPTEKDIELTARIHEMMVEKQIYRDSSLSLDTLAQMLKVTRETVSRAINRTTGKNFTHFLNEYRIKEAVRILSNASNRIINFDDLYEQLGFNSRTTFHRAFKKITGLPPAEFKNKN